MIYPSRFLVISSLIGLFCLPAQSWETCPDNASLEYELWYSDSRYSGFSFDYAYFRKTWLIPVAQPMHKVDLKKTLYALLAKYKGPSSFDRYYHVSCTLDGPVRDPHYFEYGKNFASFYSRAGDGSVYPAPTYQCIDNRQVKTNISGENREGYLQLSQSNGSVGWFKTYLYHSGMSEESKTYDFCSKDQTKSRRTRVVVSKIEQVYRDSNDREAALLLPGYLAFTLYTTPLITKQKAMPGFSGF